MTIEEIEKRWNYVFDRAYNHYDDEDLLSFVGDHVRDLIAVAKAVKELPFGESIALPWCLESFPKLNDAMNALEN